MHVPQLKDVCRRELERSEGESVRNQAVSSEYKQVVLDVQLLWLFCVYEC